MIAAVTSWRGIGASTTALLLALATTEAGPTWLVEADPAGGVLSGRMHLAPHALGGLERVAFPADASPADELLRDVAHTVGALNVVAAPTDPFRAHACHRPRLPWQPALRMLDGDVVIDIGRLRAGGVATALLPLADVVVIVTSPEVCAAVGTSEWIAAGGRVSPDEDGAGDVRLAVVAVDQPTGVAFGRPALEAEFGDSWAGWLPWEPVAVDLVHRGASLDDRRLRRSALVPAVRRLADGLFTDRPLVRSGADLLGEVV